MTKAQCPRPKEGPRSTLCAWTVGRLGLGHSLVIGILAFGLPGNMRAVEIIDHRGASHDAPENTLASIRLAWKQNADAVEIDVQFSKDGHIGVIHDDNTRKTAGVRKKVSEQTLSELKALDVGRWKDAKWSGER